MHIDGIGGSTAITTSINNRTDHSQNQVVVRKPAVNENRQAEKRQIEENNHVEERKFSEQDVIDVIQRANKEFVVYDRKFEFSIHEKTKQIMVKVIDATTDEVIRELPPEKVLDMVAAIWEVVGIIVDRKI